MNIMEKNHGNENKLQLFIVELVGTMILSLCLNLYWTGNNIFTQRTIAGIVNIDNLLDA